MPKIVTANSLSTGAVVFLDAAGAWVTSVESARLFANAGAAEEGLEIGRRDVARALIVDPFVVNNDPEGGERRGMTLRDSIRAFGPTVRFGPSGDKAGRNHQTTAEGQRDVSLR